MKKSKKNVNEVRAQNNNNRNGLASANVPKHVNIK